MSKLAVVDGFDRRRDRAPRLVVWATFLASACGGRVSAPPVVDAAPPPDAAATDAASLDASRDVGPGPGPCAADRDCADEDPCTVRERCDPAGVCRSDRSDADGDGRSAVACGGDDCDDGDPLVSAGAAERCNGADDDCDGVVDGPAASGACATSAPGSACVAGSCACAGPGRRLCAGACRDLATDPAHCGQCGAACGPDEVCRAGVCVDDPGCPGPASPVTSAAALDGLAGAADFAFDGRGGVAVAVGPTVTLRRAGASVPLTVVMPGNVVALRYTRASGLMLAVLEAGDAGASRGAIYRYAAGSAPVLWHGGLRRPGGLTVDRNDAVWFSDTDAGVVYRRAAASEGPATAVVTAVSSPTALLVDAAGRALYVGRMDTNTVMRVALDAAGGAGEERPFVGGFARVSGLAQDACGNVYVADEIVDRIWRLPATGGEALRLVTDVHNPRSLMFGAGGAWSARSLYSLSVADGTLRGASVGTLGVPAVVPAP